MRGEKKKTLWWPSQKATGPDSAFQCLVNLPGRFHITPAKLVAKVMCSPSSLPLVSIIKYSVNLVAQKKKKKKKDWPSGVSPKGEKCKSSVRVRLRMILPGVFNLSGPPTCMFHKFHTRMADMRKITGTAGLAGSRPPPLFRVGEANVDLLLGLLTTGAGGHPWSYSAPMPKSKPVLFWYPRRMRVGLLVEYCGQPPP